MNYYSVREMSPQHHFILKALPMEPLSRTYQYRKIVKPILERKRRGRINKCLEELKDLMTGTLQADGENISKLEKADILELTVRHLKRLRECNALFIKQDTTAMHMEKFWSGFQHCASEVAQFLNKYDRNITTNLIQYIANYVPNNLSQLYTINHNSNSHINGSIKIALKQSLNMTSIRMDETAATVSEQTAALATSAYSQRLDIKQNNKIVTLSVPAATSTLTSTRFHKHSNNSQVHIDNNRSMYNKTIMPTALYVTKDISCVSKRHNVWRPW